MAYTMLIKNTCNNSDSLGMGYIKIHMVLPEGAMGFD